MTIQVAFIQQEDGHWRPAMVAEIKQGDVFYIVTGGAAGKTYRATANAQLTHVNGEEAWSVEHECVS